MSWTPHVLARLRDGNEVGLFDGYLVCLAVAVVVLSPLRSDPQVRCREMF